MKISDEDRLNQMRLDLLAHTGRNYIKLSEDLQVQRDSLTFEDPDWYYRLTEQLVTLDSASTFTPSNKMQEAQLKSAVKEAFSVIFELISERLTG